MCSNVIRENKFKVKTLKKGQIKIFPNYNNSPRGCSGYETVCILQHFFEMYKGKLMQ